MSLNLTPVSVKYKIYCSRTLSSSSSLLNISTANLKISSLKPKKNSWRYLGDVLKKILSDFTVNFIETLWSTAIVPFTLSNYITMNEHLVKIIRIILEVLLEASLWLVFAGVSILTATILIIGDVHVKNSQTALSE